MIAAGIICPAGGADRLGDALPPVVRERVPAGERGYCRRCITPARLSASRHEVPDRIVSCGHFLKKGE